MQDSDESIDGLLGQIKSHKVKKITIDMSELPHSVPAGYICGAREVEAKDLKFNDLVLITESKRHRVRRVIRRHQDGVILGGDGFNDIAPHYFGGKIRRVETIWSKPNQEVNLNRKAGLALYFNWLRSFLSN